MLFRRQPVPIVQLGIGHDPRWPRTCCSTCATRRSSSPATHPTRGSARSPSSNRSAGTCPMNLRIVCVSRTGDRGHAATDQLRQWGFNAANLAGGMVAWRDDGRPVVREDGSPGALRESEPARRSRATPSDRPVTSGRELRPRRGDPAPRGRAVRRRRHRWRHHRRGLRARRGQPRPADRARRAARLRVGHVVEVVEARARRPALPAAARDPPRLRSARRASGAAPHRAASRAGAAVPAARSSPPTG